VTLNQGPENTISGNKIIKKKTNLVEVNTAVFCDARILNSKGPCKSCKLHAPITFIQSKLKLEFYSGISTEWLFVHWFQIEFGNVGFYRGRKTGEPWERSSEQGREPTTNSTHIWHRERESSPGQIQFVQMFTLLQTSARSSQMFSSLWSKFEKSLGTW